MLNFLNVLQIASNHFGLTK